MDIHDINNFKVLSEIINSGDVLVDVGSNIGDYTNLFKEILKESGKIYSIELSPDYYEILKEQNKNSGNVIVLNYAISDKNEIIPYFKGKHHCLHNILGYDVNNNLTDKSGEIESIRLDTLLKNELNIK